MDFTGKKILNKVIAMIIILAMTMSDFLLIGSNLVSYAVDTAKTSDSNVEFYAYFTKENGDKVSKIEQDTTTNNLKMYVEVSVKNEGYFDGQISLDDANFKIKNSVLSDKVSKIESNTVYLNRINAGTNAIVELEIEQALPETMSEKLLNVESKVNLSGNYTNSKKTRQISGTAKVEIDWKLNSQNTVQSSINLLTNKSYKIEEKQKRIVQFLLTSKLTDNSYPVKNTKIELNVPEKAEEVTVERKNTTATNGNAEFNEKNYVYNKENKLLSITVENNADKDGNIKFYKNATDEFIVTYVYDESDKDNIEGKEIKSTTKIQTYDNQEKSAENKTIAQEEKDGIISFDIESNEKEMFKGKIYTGEDKEYTSVTKINVNKANIAEKVTLNEYSANYIGNETYSANIFFKQTKISKSEFEKIFGKEGYIKILDNNGTVFANITDSTDRDEKDYIVINYPENIKEVNIETSKPIAEGTLNVENTKTIKETEYDRAKILTFTKISEKVAGTYDSNQKQESENSISLKETTTKASLNVSNTSLSTTEATRTKIAVTLDTSDESKDLFKNPSIKITLPKQVKKLNINYQLLHGNGLKIANEAITKEGENLVITINITGEQTRYVSDVTEGATILIDATMEQDKLAVTSNEEIKLNYTNENAVTYINNGEEKVKVNVIAKNPIIATTKINELGIETTVDEDKKDINLELGKKAQTLTTIMNVVNNETSKISNVKILGSFPTNNKNNNLGMTVNTLTSSVTKKNVKIYYTEQENPTDDLTNSSNGWSEKVDVSKVKNYLIVIDSLEIGETYTFGYKVDVPANLSYNLDATAGYTVSYKNDASNTSNTVKATTLDYNTGKSAVLEQNVVATVGNDTIKDGDTVKSGEIIKYTVTVKNTGNEDATGVTIVGNVPDGTTYVEYNNNVEKPKESIPDSEPETFIEDTNKKEVKIENQIIKAKSQITFEYMVKANTNSNKEIETTITTTNNKGEKVENKFTNKISTTEIETILVKSDSIYNNGTIKSGYEYQYILKVKNVSNKDKNNVKITVNTNDLFELVQNEYNNDDDHIEITDKTFTIEKIKAGEQIEIRISVKAKQPTNSVNTAELYATVLEGKTTYRSNKIIEKIDAIELQVDFATKTTSTTEGYLKKGDKVSYIFNIKNTGKNDADKLEIKDELSDYLVIESVTINDQNAEYAEDDVYEENSKYSILTISTPLKAGESATIVITAKADDTITYDEVTKVSNKATLYNEVEITTTDEIVYFIEKDNIKSEDDDPSSGNTGDKDEDNKNTTDGGNTTGDNRKDPSTGNKDNKNTYTIAGTAWKDENENGARDKGEQLISDVNVKLLNIETKEYVKDSSGNEISAKTNSEGLYTLTNIPEGKYIAVFEYDSSKYMLTTYKANGVATDKNSDVVLNDITINGKTSSMATTDTIELKGSIANIDIGLVDAKEFDLELNKYVSKIVVTNNAGTTTKEFTDSTLAKAEIAAKSLKDSQVVIEYIIKVTNKGEIAGYAKKIVDYKSSELNFSSSMNTDWYSQGEYVYNSSLAETKLEPGETKELKLVLTKTMTESNTGLIGNTAEIAEAYNTRGAKDKNSTPGNKTKGENDMGQADVIIGVKTGAVISYVLITLSIIIAIGVGAYFISKKVLSKEIKF